MICQPLFFPFILLMSSLLFQSCFPVSCLPTNAIRKTGLNTVQVGGEMPEEGVEEWQGRAVKDSMIEEAGYRWRMAILSYPQGKVYLEEGFFEDKSINRIRVETPDFTCRKEIRVGSPIGDIRKLGRVRSITLMPEYQRIDVFVKDMHFLISDQALIESAQKKAKLTLKDLNPTAEILAIVLM